MDVQPTNGAQPRAGRDRSAGMEALRIELTLARAALERRDTEGWRAALARVDAWLPRLWPESAALQAQRKAVQALRARNLRIASPLLGSTLTQLRSMRARQDRP